MPVQTLSHSPQATQARLEGYKSRKEPTRRPVLFQSHLHYNHYTPSTNPVISQTHCTCTYCTNVYTCINCNPTCSCTNSIQLAVAQTASKLAIAQTATKVATALTALETPTSSWNTKHNQPEQHPNNTSVIKPQVQAHHVLRYFRGHNNPYNNRV